jgi:hypothetical protein
MIVKTVHNVEHLYIKSKDAIRCGALTVILDFVGKLVV